ncbi:transposase [Streptomyces sp. NBC_00343]|uniref:transposase n=1 Tax=Streptomyces sp. NBC_00343 TaxID=2975719 RepID=UPI003FA79060
MSTRPWTVDDDLWALIEPLLPPWPERSPGPRPVADRLCLQGVLYVLYNARRSGAGTGPVRRDGGRAGSDGRSAGAGGHRHRSP